MRTGNTTPIIGWDRERVLTKLEKIKIGKEEQKQNGQYLKYQK
jgi:hypothetical protein